MKAHYIAMAGLTGGYLPNVCQSFETKRDAIDSLLLIHPEIRGLKTELQKYNYSERCEGNDYCEIQKCVCNDPEIHNDY